MAGVVVAFTEHCNATSGGCGCYEMLSVGSVAQYSLFVFLSVLCFRIASYFKFIYFCPHMHFLLHTVLATFSLI